MKRALHQHKHGASTLLAVWLVLAIFGAPAVWAQEATSSTSESVAATADDADADTEKTPAEIRYELASQAYAASNAGDHARAAELFAKALDVKLSEDEASQAKPDEKSLRWSLVYSLDAAGNKAEALEILSEMGTLYPGDDKIQRELGYRLIAAEQKDEAVREFELLCLRDNPERGDCLQLAYLYRDVDRNEDAVEIFGKLLRKDPKDTEIRRELAWLLIAEERWDDAILQFEQLVAADPASLPLRQQLAYLYLKVGRKKDAREQFEIILDKHPDRHALRLEYGYLLMDLDRPHKARPQFKKVAAQDDDQKSKEKAQEALDNLNDSYPLFFGDVYLHGFFTARFPNFIVTGRVREGINVPVVPLKVYASLRLTRDIRSAGVLTSGIYEDNVLIPALGVELAPLAPVVPELGLALFYEIGPAVYLYDADPQVELDQRAGILLYYDWMNTRPVENPKERWIWPLTYWGELYTDFIWFSRFDNNWIGLFAMKHGMNLFQKGMLLDQLYWLFDLKYDVDGIYYNNTVETGVGMRVKPWPKWNVTFYAEYRLGVYLPRKYFVFNPLEHYFTDYWVGAMTRTDDNPYGPVYHDGRIGVIFYYAW